VCWLTSAALQLAVAQPDCNVVGELQACMQLLLAGGDRCCLLQSKRIRVAPMNVAAVQRMESERAKMPMSVPDT
jgi:hypothetical protein